MLTQEYDFSLAIIATDINGKLIYSFDKMVNVLITFYHFSRDEAEQYLINSLVNECSQDYTVLYRYN